MFSKVDLLCMCTNSPILGCSPDGKVKDPNGEDPFGLLEVKCPETKFQVSPLAACSDPKYFFGRGLGTCASWNEPMLTIPKVRGKWAVLAHNSVILLSTVNKECQLKELPLTEVTGLTFRRCFVNIISSISFRMLQLNLHHHVEKLWWFVIQQQHHNQTFNYSINFTVIW